MQDEKQSGAARGSSPAERSKEQSSNQPRDRWRGEAPKPVEPRNPPKQQEGPRATFAAMKPPTLNVPKGGGALKGIGETFRTNPVTGTASAEIPLPITPAPRGPTPQLSLSYDSGQGNGLFGLGWNVGVPQIVRKTDKRLPEYLDNEESDVFVFAGEDLVPALIAPGWGRDTDTGTATVDEEERSYTIVRYRSRIEGAFSRVERWTDTESLEVHWRVTSRDNSTSFFGQTVDSRIAGPEPATVDGSKPERVFAWLLDRVVDDRGNVVLYEYAAEDLVGVSALKASEAHRKDGLAPTSNRHLKRVLYGNTTMWPTETPDFKLELVFDYGEHEAEAPAPDDDGEWDVRADPFSSYRAGFEMRTYRLCKRVLMFHHFVELEGEGPMLVRALELTYDETAKFTQLVSAKMLGYERTGEVYTSVELPPLELTYTPLAFMRTIEELDPDDARDFNPHSLTKGSQWVDLDGEGLPGVLTDRRGALHFKHNLGEGHLADSVVLQSAPNLSLQERGSAQLMDIAGSGTMSIVRLDPRASGYFEREEDGWAPLKTFAHNPNVDWSDPNLRMVDLNGDGFDDILITRGDHLVWLPSLGRDGFGPAQRVPLPRQEEKGPAVIFAGRNSSVFLADMSGDGQVDIVKITHNSVCYWPNLGYGQFGAQVVMDDCPAIDRVDRFHPSRVRLADLDGTGTADLVYFDADGLHMWPNHSGNAFGGKLTNECIPIPEALPTLAIVDLHGTGMSTLTWAPRGTPHVPVRHCSPFGKQKPFMLATMTNGMGLEVTFEYAASTRFYLADRAAGMPWATKLPFPVQVVTSVRSYDRISKTKLVTTYAYHHGHYDTVEREFRGFGRVDQTDAETFDPGTGVVDFDDPPMDGGELAQPPVLSKTWFHLGTWRETPSLEAAYATEYWAGDEGAHATLTCRVEPSLPVDEIADAHRALKGVMLRQEVYGHTREGGGEAGEWVIEPIPLTVSEQSYQAVRRQPTKAALGQGRSDHPAVFQSLPLEVRTHTYDATTLVLEEEEDIYDPRLHQWVALRYDATYGDVVQSAVVAYERRAEASPLDEQEAVYALVTETDIAHITEDGYRLSIPLETRTYELSGLEGSSPIDRATLFDHADPGEGAPRIAYHEAPVSGVKLRLVEHIKVQYYKSAELPATWAFGSVDAMALVYQTYQLDITDAHLALLAIDDKITDALLTEGKYAEIEEDTWWIPSGFSDIEAGHFYLPSAFIDPFVKTTTLTYDEHDFFVIEVVDHVGNTVAAQHDYRVLAPKEITDPNGNRVRAAFDELGRVIKVAVMGKDGGTDGDTLTDPTEVFEYVTDRWIALEPKPNYAKRTVRETHGTSPTPKFQESYVYTDGSGRVALTKTQAEPDPLTPTTPRWVGSGKTVVNNKGNPVKQYEPYFADTHELETDDDLREWGVTPLITYDAVGRVIRFENPDGTFRTTEYSPWLETAYDENDNTVSGPHQDTPTRTHFDPLGRPFLVQADSGFDDDDPPNPVIFSTRTTLDIENQPKAVIDPLGRTCQTHVFSMAGRLLIETNIDKGTRHSLVDVLGAPLRRWDERTQVFRFEYDALRRPTHLWVTIGEEDEVLLERSYYGDNPELTDPEDDNLRGQLILLFDQAGKTKLGPFDFKGNPLTSSRKLATTYTSIVDWLALDTEDDPADAETTAAGDLEAETWTETREYDALNRITKLTTPDASQFLPTYNEGSLLEAVDVKIRGAGSATSFVANIDYDAKGQRTAIEYGNGTATAYTYDPLTFRLETLVTTRTSPSNTLQDLTYTYDPVGNITAIADAAHDDVYFDNTVVSASQTFEYDAVYRLVRATGREHKSIADVQIGVDGAPIQNLPHDNDSDAVRNYEEEFEYDAVGNILSLFHQGFSPSATWKRYYDYGPFDGVTPVTNRLRSSSLSGDTPGTLPYSAEYTPDEHGNIVAMPHLSSIEYSPFDQISHATNGTQDTYFTYGADGQRVRKVYDTNANLIKERIYLGGFEIYRERVTTPTPAITLERETLHIMDGTRRIAMVETKTINAGTPVGSPVNLFRFQYTNHLGSAHLECDEGGLVITYEEMHPYGSSAYRSAASGSEVSARRYRYTGKERDEETGLDYFGARYYAPWLGRWTSADPLGLQAGLNLYQYGRASPVRFVDPTGKEPVDLTGIGEAFAFGGIAERRQRKEVGAGARAAMAAAGRSFREVGRAESVVDDGAGGGPTHRLVDPAWASRGGYRPEDMLSAGGGGGAVGGQNIGDAIYENMTEEQRWQAEESMRRTAKPAMIAMTRALQGDLPGAANSFVKYMTAAMTYIDPAEAHAPRKSDWPILDALREAVGFLPTGDTSGLGEGVNASGTEGEITISPGPNSFNIAIAGTSKGLLSTIDEAGVVDLAVEAGEDSPMRGSPMFAEMMKHYGSRVQAIRGFWSAEGTMRTNIDEFNVLTAGGAMGEKEAATKVWTGRRANEHGFSVVESVQAVGSPGAYTKVTVVFRRP